MMHDVNLKFVGVLSFRVELKEEKDKTVVYCVITDPKSW